LSRPNIIAIDGPVATGKSVVGRRLAQRLGYRFLDTGAMYRALTWLAIEQNIDPNDEASLVSLAESATITVGENGEQVFINGRLVPLEEQRLEIGKTVSLVAQVPGVRNAMVHQQRQIAREGKIVMAGRDIGTVVAPSAPLKLYFQASGQERTKRRYEELRARGHAVELDQVLEEMAARDRLDSERVHSPLRPARDAHLIDTEGLTVEQVVEKLMELIGES
jgi:cytidylate kinase